MEFTAVHPFRMMPLASVRFRTAGLQSYSMKCADIFLTLVFGSIAPQTPGLSFLGNTLPHPLFIEQGYHAIPAFFNQQRLGLRPSKDLT
mgnify:CR=1 FL=1